MEPGNSPDHSNAAKRGFAASAGTFELVHTAESKRASGSCQAGNLCSEIQIEVTSLDSLRQVIEGWLSANPSVEAPTLGDIVDTDWDSRLFTVQPAPDCLVTFWEWSHPVKGKPVALEGALSAEGLHFAIVVARWNAFITDRLLQGSLDALLRSGARASDIQILRVPGAWEIPSAARKLAETGRFDAVVTLGLLLRGETAHYEAIYNEVARGIGQSQQETGIPHAFGVLTCETVAEALDRAGLKAGNKGFEAACAAIEMVSLHRKICVEEENTKAT